MIHSGTRGCWRYPDEDVVPLPVAALLRVVRADDAVAAALLAKGNPVLVAAVSDSHATGHAKGHAEGRAEGLAEGLAEALADLADAIVRVLARRNLTPTPAELERVRGEGDRAVLKQWLEQAVTCADVDEMFAAGV